MVRGYQQYCPIAKGAEILAERWTPLIVRNLHLGCDTFSELHRGCPRMSGTLLAQRLRSLERDGVVVRTANPNGRGHRYHLTSAGQELVEVVFALGTWGARWLDLGTRDYDPAVVLWAWAKQIDPDRLPESRVVVRFDLTDASRHTFWMILDRPGAEVCAKDPGLDIDLVVTTDPVTLTDYHRGRLSWSAALRSERLRVAGPRGLVRALPTWGGLSPFAGTARAH
jgi:DNA-binding HxlR family transcriptional regulator